MIKEPTLYVPHELALEMLNQVQYESAFRENGTDYKRFMCWRYDVPVVYLQGSNEPMDWVYNILGIIWLPWGHPGYQIKARRKPGISELFARLYREFGEKFYVISHSHGAGVLCEWMDSHPKQSRRWLRGGVAFAPPVGRGIFSCKDTPNLQIYMKKDDFVLGSRAFFPYKFHTTPFYLPATKDIEGMAKDHQIKAYTVALAEFIKEKTSEK